MAEDNERVVSVADERTIPEITQAIEAAGGQVLHQLGRVLIVYAPAETRTQLTNLPAGTRLATAQEALSMVRDLDEAEQLAVRAMHLRQTPEYQEAKRNRPNRDAEWGTRGLLAPDLETEQPRPEPPPPSEESPGPVETTTPGDPSLTDSDAKAVGGPLSERLINKVAVGLVFVNGIGPDYTMNLQDYLTALADVQQGLTWLGTQEPKAKVTWVYDVKYPIVGIEPWKGARWKGLPESFYGDNQSVKGIDAALFREDNNCLYFFRGSQYVRFSACSTTVDAGFPKPIANWPGLPTAFQNGIDAALWREDNGAVYFFKGNQYVRFTKVSDGVDPGYPALIATDWPALPTSFQAGIDAALMRKDNHKIYFFKGNQYVRFSNVSDGVDPGYPQPLTPDWGALNDNFKNGIDAAVWRGDNSKIYFFKNGRFGGEYLRYSDVSAGIDAGYPQPIVLSAVEAERLWRDPAMVQLGYSADDAGVQQYVETLRSSKGTDWAYAAFITKNPVNWFAYVFTPPLRMVVACPSGISDIVFAHETGHIFGAPDEYQDSGCKCRAAGYDPTTGLYFDYTSGNFFRTRNGNCANCIPDPGAMCLMRNNAQAICTHTVKHLGWGPFLTKIDAAVWRVDNAKTYLFSGDEYIRYSNINAGRDKGWPARLASPWTWKGLPTSFQAGIDAALFREDNNCLYFFRGSQYVRFSAGSTTVDAGYPKPIAGNWAGLPTAFQNGIDAALWREDNGAVYFFKGNQYVRFTKVSNGVDPGYPALIAANWHGLPTSFQAGIDAALMRKDNHKIYFFKGTRYVRFSNVSDGVDPGYPNWIDKNWMPFPR